MIEKRISFKLDPGDIFIYDNTLLKTASVNLPDNIPYDPNFLYVEVRAVSAGEYYGNNKNIDYFPEGELNPPKKNAGYGKETFITAHVFKNHDNKDVANAIGDVLKVTWDDEMKGVNLLLRIDKLVSPSVVRGFEAGYITDVSMGCRVHHVVCSICGHNARTKVDYCNHLKTEKGKIYPDGKKVQEINIQPKFHDISVVLNGAEKIAKVMRIYKDDSTKREKTASLTSEDMTRIALDLGMSKHASTDSVDGMLKLAGFEGGLSGVTMEKLASHEDVLNFFSSYIDSVNRENLEKLALEQEFDKHDPKQQAFGKLATIQKLSEFEKRIEGEIIRTSAKGVEEKMQAEVDADDAFTAALNAAKMRNFKELEDEQLDEISKKLLAISEEKRIPRFEILRSFFTVLATKGIHLTLTEFSHLTMHVLKGMAFEGDHDVFERKINDYRAHLTQMIMDDIRRQEITPGTGLFNVQNAIANQESPLGMHGLDKMIMALSGAAPFGMHAVVRRPMMKLASYQAGACSPAGIMGSDMTNEVIFTLETMVEKCPPLADRNKPIMSYAADLMEIAEMEKTARAEEGKPKKKKDHSLRNAVLSGTVGGLGLAFGKLNRVIGEHEKNTADEWRLEGVLNSHLFNKDLQADDTLFETMADRSDKSARKFKRIGALSYGIGAAGAATSAYHLHNRYKKKKQAEQEKTAASDDYYFENVNQFKKLMKAKPELAKRRFESWDFEDSDDYEAARSWHYNTFKASPEERKLLAERQRIKKQDKSMAEKTQEAYRSQHETNVKRAKRLENIGLGVGLGGAGLVGLSAYSKKLPEKYRMPLGLGGIGVVMGSSLAMEKGKGIRDKSYEKYNQPMNDFNNRQEVRDSNIAYRKYLKNQQEHWAFEGAEAFEKLAALEEYYDEDKGAWRYRGTESDDERKERLYEGEQKFKYINDVRKTRKVDRLSLLAMAGGTVAGLKGAKDPTKLNMKYTIPGLGLMIGGVAGVGYGEDLRKRAKGRYNKAMDEYYEKNL